MEKWFEIWDVLFLEVVWLESLWYEIFFLFILGILKDGEDYFVDFFFNIFDYKI